MDDPGGQKGECVTGRVQAEAIVKYAGVVGCCEAADRGCPQASHNSVSTILWSDRKLLMRIARHEASA